MRKTLILTGLIALVYVIFSTALLYIPTKTLLAFGFNVENMLGALTYSFLHMSPAHLVGNLILLIPVGIIAEKKLSAKEFYIVYLTAGVISAVVYGLMFPENYLVGASAAISAILAIAFIVDIKKAVIALLISSLLISVVGPQLTSIAETQLEKLQKESLLLESELNETNIAIKEAEELNDTEQLQLLLIMKQQQFDEYNSTIIKQSNVDEGLEREKKSHTHPLIHLAGSFTGLAYLIIFRRDILWEMPSQVIPRKYLKKKSKKK